MGVQYGDLQFLKVIHHLLEKEMATHSGVLARRSPWTEESGRPCPWGHRASDTSEAAKIHTSKHTRHLQLLQNIADISYAVQYILKACFIHHNLYLLVPNQERRVPATGPPRKSLRVSFELVFLFSPVYIQ